MLACGIDIGSSNLKLALVDAERGPLWRRTLPTPRHLYHGCPAVDAQEVMHLLERLMLEGWCEVGHGRPLAAVCATGVGEDGVYVDAALRPLSNAIAWFDHSASAQAEWIRHHAPAIVCTGLGMDKSRTGARWRWYAQMHPRLVARAHGWIALTDLPASIWSGRAFMSQTLAARSGCYDVEQRQWRADLMQLCAAPEVPPVLRAGEIVGEFTSPALQAHGVVDASTRIIAGGHDHPFAASYIQRINPLACTDSVGTANVIYGQTPWTTVPALDADVAWTVPLRAHSGLACLGAFEFGAAMHALERCGTDIRAMLDAPRMPGHPRPASATALSDAGIEPRRVFERIGFAARRMLERMHQVGVPAGPIVATGGWSRSRSLLELRASIYGQAVHVLDEPEPAVVGAALIGLEACGQSINLDSMQLTIVEPDPVWAAVYAESDRHE